jgi:energy-coupling factor transporter transmembrane protein EcfT
VHPASRILIYLLAALAIPGLPFFLLSILFLLAIGALIVQRRAPLGLIYRTRWLLLILLFGYAYSFPGESIWPALGNFGPSWEGAQQGGEQAARLIVVLLWLDVLVLRLPADELLSGLYQLIRPFARLGIDPSRVALRLGLTLRAIEGLERGRGNLKRLLDFDTPVVLPTRIQLRLSRLRLIDLALPGLLGIGLIVQWFIPV